MSFLNVILELSRDHAEALGDALIERAALSVSVEDALEGTAAEKPIFGEPGADGGLWDSCRMTVLFDSGIDAGAQIVEACKGLNIDVPVLNIATVEDTMVESNAHIDLTGRADGPIVERGSQWGNQSELRRPKLRCNAHAECSKVIRATFAQNTQPKPP